MFSQKLGYPRKSFITKWKFQRFENLKKYWIYLISKNYWKFSLDNAKSIQSITSARVCGVGTIYRIRRMIYRIQERKSGEKKHVPCEYLNCIQGMLENWRSSFIRFYCWSNKLEERGWTIHIQVYDTEIWIENAEGTNRKKNQQIADFWKFC